MASTQLQTLDLQLPLGSLDTYIAQIQRVPLLTAEEEYELASKLQQDNDLNAARGLILSHLRYVVRIARGYMGYGLPLGDLIQEGNVGLMKAVRRFDPTVGVRLVSFAVHWIKAEIHEYVLRNWRIVKVATTKAQRKLFFNLRKMKKRLGWFTQEEVAAVANDLGVTCKDVLAMEARLNAMDTPFDAPEGDDDQAFMAPAHTLEADNSDPALLVEAQDSSDDTHEQLANALSGLDERSLDILQQRYLNEEKATLHELADKYSISAERVRQLEANALKKLRQSMAA